MVGQENQHLVYETEEIIEQERIKEPWSQGAPSPVMGPGLLNKYADTLRKPWAKVHFVGRETAFEWKGYMEDAVRAGERGAKEVVEALSPSSSRGLENL
jgi:monoamine oxidase